MLDDDQYVVIGVMPADFENVLATSAELWTPLQYDTSLPSEGREWGHHLRMVARLRAGRPLDQARRELDDDRAARRCPIRAGRPGRRSATDSRSTRSRTTSRAA